MVRATAPASLKRIAVIVGASVVDCAKTATDKAMALADQVSAAAQ